MDHKPVIQLSKWSNFPFIQTHDSFKRLQNAKEMKNISQTLYLQC